jgi:septal ring factor EnvC (AmiA/AmiB activator)
MTKQDETYKKQLEAHIKSLEISADGIVEDIKFSETSMAYHTRMIYRLESNLSELSEQIKLAKEQIENIGLETA